MTEKQQFELDIMHCEESMINVYNCDDGYLHWHVIEITAPDCDLVLVMSKQQVKEMLSKLEV